MRGRQVFMDSLRAHGVRCIFGNPGTTENPLLDSLADYPDIRYVTTLHEGVAVSAASYYAQASGETCVANVHVAPGLGNGLGSLFGALKAGSPLILTAGQQDTRMRLRSPMLQHDLVAMAAPLTKWSVQAESADEMAELMRRAFKIANDRPRGPVFVALPVNVMEQETRNGAVTGGRVFHGTEPPGEGVRALAELLVASRDPVIIAGDDVARQGATEALTRLAEATGAAVFNEGLRLQMPFPNRHPNARGAVGFEAGSIRRNLQGHDLVLMLGGPFFEEIWFDDVSPIPDGARAAQITDSPGPLAESLELAAGFTGDLKSSLEAVHAALSALATGAYREAAAARNAALADASRQRRERAQATLQRLADARPMTPARALTEIAGAMPPDGILVDESITASVDLANAFEFAGPGTYYGQRGGGIGQGIAGALGVAMAQPSRPVILISGDGSAMYHIQSLWTAANLGLDIVFVILANREYRVLKHNMDIYRSRYDNESNRPYPHMDLAPALDFTTMAAGMGVPGTRVEDPDALAGEVARAVAAGGPHLIEVRVSGKP
jgi:benzoylformate decarboxylase